MRVNVSTSRFSVVVGPASMPMQPVRRTAAAAAGSRSAMRGEGMVRRYGRGAPVSVEAAGGAG
jgi:hypothetical protein